MSTPVSVFWFRRDLRLSDNAGLYHALKSGLPVIPVFIFDTYILGQLQNKADARVDFIYQQITDIKNELNKTGNDLLVFYDTPESVFEQLLKTYPVQKVFTNHDYEPYAKKRDEKIRELLQKTGAELYTYKDQVIFEKEELLSLSAKPYTVYTPYSKAWLQKLNDFYTRPYPVKKYAAGFLKISPSPMPTLENMGFTKSKLDFPSPSPVLEQVKHYHETRDFPALDSTSRLGLHLRFGTISIRKLVRFALTTNATFLKELVWREFFMQILWHYPHVINESFRKKYDLIRWRNNEEEFKKWCEGKTGYPMVDAGMRELNATGFMHNRVRMITASFLTKHLLIDWRWGEAYFAEKLLDYDLAANNGNWQWVAGTGCDAAPYFRVFNPAEQAKKFDAAATYIKKWVPELESFDYPAPMVDHAFARERALKTYKAALGEAKE